MMCYVRMGWCVVTGVAITLAPTLWVRGALAALLVGAACLYIALDEVQLRGAPPPQEGTEI